jgi:hypothetical protein
LYFQEVWLGSWIGIAFTTCYFLPAFARGLFSRVRSRTRATTSPGIYHMAVESALASASTRTALGRAVFAFTGREHVPTSTTVHGGGHALASIASGGF